jgi:hypothetical protein
MRKETFTLRFAATPENQATFDVIRRWHNSIPTAYFLDICSIDAVKEYMRTKSYRNKQDENTIAALREVDLPHNGISYFPALMEKASDQRSNFNADSLIEEAYRDCDALSSFYQHAALLEPREFVSEYIAEMFGGHLEILGPNYHDFLNFANAQNLSEVAANNRLKAAKVICDKAGELGIKKSHPLVLGTISCIYECAAARGVMKFRKNAEKFKSSNALGDIQLIQRVAKLTKLIEEAAPRGGRYARAGFLTSDKGLKDFYSYFFVNEVVTDSTGSSDELAVTVKAPQLFWSLHNAEGSLKSEKHYKELLKLYELLEIDSK